MSEKMMLVDELITQIKEGVYKPNEKLPSENELADQYGIPRMVVRKAYEQLQDLGFIFSKQGRGSYVQNRKQQIPLILTGDISFSEKMNELGYDFRSENVCFEKIPYESDIYHSLKVNKQDEVYKISRLRIVDGCPIALHTSYAAKSVFQQIDRDGPGITSIFHYYKTHGYKEFTSGQSQLSVVFPNESERKILQCSSLIPLLLLESLCMDKETGTVLEVSRIKYRSDCFTYLI
ncbi:GntR family transcriptional regulator [Cytobacillus pseudoceanisediminis]|uniref:GntR family transcriptional regulator n=1 Tax=Cytobacillus pseudoceanisediminis TaxID=3051614 RepID=UPI003C2E858E